MTVLSRSKNAAARVTGHDCKWTRDWQAARAVHTRSGHPQFPPGSRGVARSRWGRAVSSSRPDLHASARPLVVSADEELLDDLLRLLAAAGPNRARHRRARPCAGPTAPRWFSSGPMRWPAAAVRALPRRPGVVVVSGRRAAARGVAPAVEVGAERVAVLPTDETGCCPDRPRRPVPGGAWRLVVVGGSAAVGAARARWPRLWPWPPHRACSWSTPIRGAAVSTCCSVPSVDGLRWPDLTGLRGRVAGEALCWPPCPRCSACTSCPGRRRGHAR